VTDRFRLVPAAYVVLRRDAPRRQVLLQLREGTGYMDGHWATAAAGHVEREEPVFDAACREAAEELGITVDPADLVPVTVMHRTGRTGLPIDERVDFFFECRRWTGQPRRVETDKSAALEWFDLDGLPDPLVPHELFVYRSLASGSLPTVTTFGFPTG
jgi:8-oxo-dGTP pyrophosphatase MutT (NUDIX family)